MFRHTGFCWLAVAVFVLLTGAASETLGGDHRGRFGFKVGMIGSGTINTERKEAPHNSGEMDTDDSYSAGVFFEYPVHRRIWPLLSLDIYGVKPDVESFGDYEVETETALDIALGVKVPCVSSDGRLSFRPAASFGYAFVPEIYSVKASHHWTLKTYCEMVVFTDRGTGFMGEVGVLWSVSGENGDYDMSSGAILLMRVGLLF